MYAAYGTGWEDPSGLDPKRRGLTDEAVRLARVVTELLPGEAEGRALLALMLHSDARAAARRDGSGAFVPLAEQDVSSWSRELIEEAERHLTLADLAHIEGKNVAGASHARVAVGLTEDPAVRRYLTRHLGPTRVRPL